MIIDWDYCVKHYLDDASYRKHRLDGPAVVYKYIKMVEYFINDIKYSSQDYLKYIQENHPENFPKVFAEIFGSND